VIPHKTPRNPDNLIFTKNAKQFHFRCVNSEFFLSVVPGDAVQQSSATHGMHYFHFSHGKDTLFFFQAYNKIKNNDHFHEL